MIYNNNNWTVDFAERNDCRELARDLRDIDKYEIYAVGGDTPLEGVVKSYERSLYCYTVKHEGKVIMMFGVCPIQTLSQQYCCWCLATNEIKNTNKEFLRACRDFVNTLADKFGIMINWVAKENAVAIRWLKWCGFEVGEPKRHGLHGEIMRKVVKRRCAH